MKSFWGLWLFLLGLFGGALPAQQFHVITSDSRVMRLDVSNCTFVQVAQVLTSSTISDIAFAPNGQLYGITTDGRLLLINLANGATQVIHNFTEQDIFLTSLVVDPNGVFYTAGGTPYLISYDLNTGEETNHGFMGYSAAGDLTFYQGQLMMAATSNDMVVVDIQNPANSMAAFDFDVGSASIFGIVTYVESCSQTVTYATDDSNLSRVYEVNFETETFTAVCQYPFIIFGAASELEFVAASYPEITGIAATPTSCLDPFGTLVIEAEGGTGALEYSIDGIHFQSSPSFDGLEAGLYTIFVRDQEICQISVEAEVPLIGTAPVLSAQVSATECGLPNGSVNLQVQGGVEPYVYAINGNESGGQVLFSDLAAGDYIFQVEDGQGCLDELSVSIATSEPVVLDLIQIKACGPGQSSIQVVASGGSGSLMYSLDGQAAQGVGSFENLGEGNYQVVASDGGQCRDTMFLILPSVPVLRLEISDVLSCGDSGSRFSALASGGNGGYSYSLNNSVFSAQAAFEDLAPGTYVLVVQDVIGCTFDTVLVFESYEGPYLTELVANASTCQGNDGSLEFSLSGESPPFVMRLDGNPVATVSPIPHLSPGEHLIEVFDSQGCMFLDSVFIKQDCPIYLPNAFSPNDDGRNDRFGLYSGAVFYIHHFQVWDRWGGMVYEAEDFTSDQVDLFWDGFQNKQPLPAGIYVYTILLTNALGEIVQVSGEVHLLR
ncbi:MAG TPA: gliding motility-associated C-terminal domain-containing protein [Saprospiraceae bacterium]|nr:gliding motility-associated C-terminal domain-containing protein [Saprospiraceae bacterium]HMQ84097.1 gliding motility-associated C-terminal domain-containing protein [Saprospiraceae bacterium]